MYTKGSSNRGLDLEDLIVIVLRVYFSICPLGNLLAWVAIRSTVLGSSPRVVTTTAKGGHNPHEPPAGGWGPHAADGRSCLKGKGDRRERERERAEKPP